MDRQTNNPSDDNLVGQPFDQTNGQVEGLEGDSDGSIESDTASRAERSDLVPGPDDGRDNS